MDESIRILVVDDDRVFLDMSEEVIGDGYEVSLASSGAQALEMLRSGGAPDLILLDIDMPDMDGYETLKHIRGIAAVSDTPVIFLTGINSSDAELNGLRLGAQDFITKPFARDNLMARIQLRLESGRQARRLKAMSERLMSGQTDDERTAALTQGLTPAECAVARLIVQGCGNKEIAQRLNYSMGYVKNLATQIYDKMEVHGRAQLRALFYE